MLDELEDEICEHLLEGELALFCGAGISKNSGLPLANELKRRILETLLQTKQDVKQAMRMRYPFEAFMQSLFNQHMVASQDLRVEKIFDIFQHSNPNSNHLFIARLAKHGYLKTVVTTNFDLLIERALLQERLTEGADFKRYHREELFSAIDQIELREFSLFKLHGSVHDWESIRTTLADVASKSLSEKRMNVIKHLFSTGKHKAVLVLGYSCSDLFDVIPQIQSILTDNKKVFFIENTPSKTTREVSNVGQRKKANPFLLFPGQWIKCNTDLLIKNLWTALEESIGKYQLIRADFDCMRQVDEWLGRAKKNLGLKSFIAGFVLWESQLYSKPGDIQLFDLARFYYDRALEYATEKNDPNAMLACNYEMGRVYSSGRASTKKAAAANFKKAIECYKEGLRIATSDSHGNESQAALCCHGLAICYENLKEFKTAKDYLKKSRQHYRHLIDQQQVDTGISSSYLQLGNIHLKENNPAEALACYLKSFRLRPLIPMHCINCGIAYQGLRKFDKAIDYFKRVEKLAEERGDILTLNTAYLCLSNVYRASGSHVKSESYKETLKLNQDRMRGFQ